MAEHLFNQLQARRLTAIVQSLFYLEVTNTLVLAQRKNRISSDELHDYLECLLMLPFESSVVLQLT